LATGDSWDVIAMKMQNIANSADAARIAMYGMGGTEKERAKRREETTSPIRQAGGGDWLVTRPTLFMAGEAGPERATFTPQRATGNTNYHNSNVTINVTDTLAAAYIVEQTRRGRLARMTETM
jgi:hypothetical protein